MPGLNSISPKTLMRLIGTRQCPTLIDVCIDDDFALDPRLIPTAGRLPHKAIAGLAPQLRDQRVVVICQKGKKLSQGAAAILRSEGVAAEILEGGIFAWRDADLPLIPAAAVPGQLWVTRHRPKIDRIACPWLIRRFVDPNARFLFVPPDDVAEVAEKFEATAFDTAEADWSHQGEMCTFDTMLDRFCLDTDPLRTMATVIRGADTNRHDLAPQVAGLLAISVGLSRAFKSDIEQLDQAMVLYDALYAWARDGQDEGHDWTETAKRRAP